VPLANAHSKCELFSFQTMTMKMIVNEFFNPVGNSLQQLVSGQDGSQFTSDVKRTARVWSCSKLGTADRFGCADA